MFDQYEQNKRVVGEYTLLQTDPYAQWVIVDKNGKRVKEIEGVFTNTRSAMAALQEFLTKKVKIDAQRVQRNSRK